MKVKGKRNTKRVGRPPTGKALPVRPVRMSKEQADAVMIWAKAQDDKPNWSEAVRRLIERALGA